MYIKKVRSCGVFLILIYSLFLSGCMINNQKNGGRDKTLDNKELTLQDIAYNRTKNPDYRIGIEENGRIVPYLVLTDEYNGECLLLREFLLDEPMKYNVAKEYSGYYENSEIDKYLNEEFINRFSSELRNNIVDSTIVITARASLDGGGKNTTFITRKVFLLSFTELNGSGSRTDLKEGEPLEYFSNKSNRIAYYETGRAGNWWLRTPNAGYADVVNGVTSDGVIGIGGIHGPEGEYLIGVRPAFCLNRETKIVKEEGELFVLVKD